MILAIVIAAVVLLLVASIAGYVALRKPRTDLLTDVGKKVADAAEPSKPMDPDVCKFCRLRDSVRLLRELGLGALATMVVTDATPLLLPEPEEDDAP